MSALHPELPVMLTLEYDGSAFSGWQRQSRDRSVQEEIEKALLQATGEHITVYGASRTDAGVSAAWQCAHFYHHTSIPADRFFLLLNTLLPADVRVIQSEEMREGFHARFSCRGKIYTYRIHNARYASAIHRNTTAFVPVPLDIRPMRQAAQDLVGTHDFAAFQASGGTAKTTIRTLYSITVEQFGQQIVITVHGNAFLYNMVRIIAGTLIEIGQGKRPVSCFQEAFHTHSRLSLGITAPASGLELSRIFY